MSKSPVDEKDLNSEQKQAVTFGEGPLLIIAGAGTGKTTVVTERIKYLINSSRAKPSEILALTFTEKAAREMEERVDVLMPYGYTSMWISTFHKFADRLLRAEAIHIGLNPAYRLMTDTDATMLFKKNLFQFDLTYFRPLGNPTKFIGGMLQHFSRLQDEDVSPIQYLDWVRSTIQRSNVKLNQKSKDQIDEETLEIQKYEELAKAYRAYQELKVKEGVMDFGDLITQTLALFRTRKNILGFYQKQFRYILVDEFQDTNIAQNELVALLAGSKQNITAVCDDDQCLPGDSAIATPKGTRKIKSVHRGDVVYTAVGKGHISISHVNRVIKRKKRARMICFTTESGKTLTVTDNHKMFGHVPGRNVLRDRYYVYLMHRRNLGWRLGTTNDLAQRLRLERSADRILAVRDFQSLKEAQLCEIVYSLQYGIPTYPFMPRKQMALSGEWLEKLFHFVDSEHGAERLCVDLGIDRRFHHMLLGAVVRGTSERVTVTLKMCSRRYTVKHSSLRILISPKIAHLVRLETASQAAIQKLVKAGIEIVIAKKGWKVQRQFSNLSQAVQFSAKLVQLTGAFFETKFDVARRGKYSRAAVVMPAGNILPGMMIPVMQGKRIVYEQVVQRTETYKTQHIYDLEIDRTHNYIAEGVIVHNSIYKFRGAAVSNVLSFRKHFPKTKLIVLSHNYRSTQAILDASYQLIQHNNPDRLEVKEHINKKLVAQRKRPGEWPKLLYLDRVENEADTVVKEIKRLVDGGGLSAQVGRQGKKYQWKDVAILVRANNHAEPFARALMRHDIPFQFLGPGQLFRQPEIKDLIAYLQVLHNFEDNVALFRVYSMDYFALHPRDIAAIINLARKSNLSLFEASEVIVNERSVEGAIVPAITEETKQTVAKLVSMIHRHLGLLTRESAGQILFYFLSDTGMMKNILDYSAPIDERKANNISKFFSKLKTYETDHQDAGVAAVLDWIELSMELGESPIATDTDWVTNNAVNILSIHSSKGLEFPTVFLVNLVSARFPTRERSEQIPIPEDFIKEELPEGDYHLEEERRLCYVGMTRAKDFLYLTGANYYGEGKREKKLSPFVYEVIGEHMVVSPSLRPAQMSLLDWKKDVPSVNAESGSTPITVTYLSYSQIETFRLCPLHYKLRYILHIPTPPSASLSFGTSIHEALRDFYELHAKEGKVSKESLLLFYEARWHSEGYENKQYEEKMKVRGKEYLDQYYTNEYSTDTRIVAVEQPFTVPIEYGGKTLKIGGKIDRIDQYPDGRIEIIDYKTGRMPSKRAVDTNLQLSMYAIAASEIPAVPFGRKAEEITLSLYFLDTQTKISTTRTTDQLEKEKILIVDIAKQIEQSDFRCSGNPLCSNCEYKLFCSTR